MRSPAAESITNLSPGCTEPIRSTSASLSQARSWSRPRTERRSPSIPAMSTSRTVRCITGIRPAHRAPMSSSWRWGHNARNNDAAPMKAVTAEAWTSRTGRSEIGHDTAGVTWLEHDFAAARSRIVRDSRPLTPDAVDVATLNGEYGGGSYLIAGTAVISSDRRDLRLYRLSSRQSPTPLTP